MDAQLDYGSETGCAGQNPKDRAFPKRHDFQAAHGPRTRPGRLLVPYRIRHQLGQQPGFANCPYRILATTYRPELTSATWLRFGTAWPLSHSYDFRTRAFDNGQ